MHDFLVGLLYLVAYFGLSVALSGIGILWSSWWPPAIMGVLLIFYWIIEYFGLIHRNEPIEAFILIYLLVCTGVLQGRWWLLAAMVALFAFFRIKEDLGFISKDEIERREKNLIEGGEQILREKLTSKNSLFGFVLNRQNKIINRQQMICFEKKFAEPLYSINLKIYQDSDGFANICLLPTISDRNTEFCSIYRGFSNPFNSDTLELMSLDQYLLTHHPLRFVISSEVMFGLNEKKILEEKIRLDITNLCGWFREMFPPPHSKRGPTRIILLNICLALAPLDLPPYIILEIVDWLPFFDDSKIPHGLKIRWIQAAKKSIKRCWDARKSTLVVRFGKGEEFESIFGKIELLL